MTAISLPHSLTPQLLQKLNWILDPLAYMETNAQRYGDLFCAGGLFNVVFVSHPEAIRYILTNDNNGKLSAPGEAAVNKMDASFILKPMLGGNSMILLSGEAHRRRRKLVMPPLHGERLKVYADMMREITLATMTDLAPGTPFKARDLAQTITMRVILQAVFGLHNGERYRRLEILLAKRLNMTSSPLSSFPIFFPVLQTDLGSWSIGGLSKIIATEIEEILYAEIRDRRAHPDPDRNDILSLLLLARDEDGNGLSDQDLRNELVLLLVAGHETTATALAWSLYWTHREPAIKNRILKEIQQTGKYDDPFTLTKLPYLEAVCNEVLRIYPVSMLTFTRQVEQPIELIGYKLAPGTTLMACIYLLHRREDLYPNPNQFRPERFLERQYSSFEFMPFGAGARHCVGMAMAMYELKIALGTLLWNFNMTLASNQPVRPQRRGITLGMKGSVDMIFLNRRHDQ